MDTAIVLHHLEYYVSFQLLFLKKDIKEMGKIQKKETKMTEG